MSEDGDVLMNTGALDDAGSGLEDRDGLNVMKQAIARIASDRSMFGDVPNAEAASAALESAALTLLTELERAGVGVRDIAAGAHTASGIAVDADGEARGALTAGGYDPFLSFEARLNDQPGPYVHPGAGD
ncbi:hypothetical protein GCM10009716_34130 [Streptomyces sodiiphilus]|uniref:Uncharacterized protein n=1 Tax=Streptomyces sodiiphilus TaxID=226217 RepID=A0ABP5AWC2_9ACTN